MSWRGEDGAGGGVVSARIGVMGAGGADVGGLLRSLRRLGVELAEVREGPGMVGTVSGGGFDALVVEGDDVEAIARAVDGVSGADPMLSVVALVGAAGAADVVEVVRAGAVDVVLREGGERELSDRLVEAVGRTRLSRAEFERAEGLSRMCRRLSEERRSIEDRLESLAARAIDAQEPAGGVARVEEGGLELELDVERLLRGSLEGLAGRMRSMNAAVFLPTSSGDYALGAYVNADMPRESCDAVLDELAEVLPSAVEREGGLVVAEGASALGELLGEAGPLLGGSALVAGACVERGEAIAVVACFRDAEVGFSDEEVEELRAFRAVFTRRLARVVRVHNRTVEGLAWFGFDVDGAEGAGEGDGGWENDGWGGGEEWRDAA